MCVCVFLIVLRHKYTAKCYTNQYFQFQKHINISHCFNLKVGEVFCLLFNTFKEAFNDKLKNS